MEKPEDYITKQHPTVDDWIEYNSGLFAALRGEESEAPVQHAPLVDLQRHAAEAGESTREYFEKLQARVGDLGEFTLRLVKVEMDGASHVVIAHEDDDFED